MSHLFYGVAYYDEYMPEDRLAKDIALMRETGINVVRIAESTWSTLEPEEGQYNFYHIDRVLEAMHEAGIAVIVGTPTYAVPANKKPLFCWILALISQCRARLLNRKILVSLWHIFLRK